MWEPGRKAWLPHAAESFFSVFFVFLPATHFFLSVIHFFLSVFVPWGMDDVFITKKSVCSIVALSIAIERYINDIKISNGVSCFNKLANIPDLFYL